MNNEQLLYWHQGLFLQPQHFQQNDALIEHRLARTIGLVTPFPWGLISLKINEAALSARQCKIEQLSVRFAEGTLAEYPGNAVLQTRSLDLESFVGGGRTLYVGLRRFSSEGNNAQVFDRPVDGAQADARFAVAADPQAVNDRLSNAPQARVRSMFYVLRLFWEDELEHLGAYELLPVMRLELEGDHVRTVQRYVPPCVNLAASPALLEMLREMRNELLGRARQLSVFKFASGGEQVQVDSTQFNHLMALAVLNRYGPLLTHFLEAPQTSPVQLHSALCQLVGELSLFSERCDMLGEAPDGRSLVCRYKHNESGAAISEVITLIGQLLNDISVGSEMLVRLQLQGGFYQAELPDGFFGPRHRYFMVARSDNDAEWLSESLPRDGKLGTLGSLDAMISRALPGVDLIHLQTPPQGVPRVAGAEFFRLETVSDAWDVVQRERQVAFFLPDAPEELRLELVVVRV